MLIVGLLHHKLPRELIEFTPGRELPALGDALARLGPDDLLFALSQHAVEFAH
jgi:uroporphyrinogen-III synthase